MDQKKSEGITTTERYLKRLCEHSFLSLWSYPNLFFESGKELCDLLVVCGNDVIIFSDKNCKFSISNNVEKDWDRWFRNSVKRSASQTWGALRQIKKFPNKLFIDNKCQEAIPVPLELSSNTKFHLVVVANGASEQCIEHKGGIGTLIFYNEIKGFKMHKEPFIIGDLDPNQPFVHVLDEIALELVMTTLTTISDFTDYLIKRELFCRSNFKTYSPGEEDLLGFYLLNWDFEITGLTNFQIDAGFSDTLVNQIPSDYWFNLQENPQWIEKTKADQKSYFWDHLIENVSHHTVNRTLLDVTPDMISDTEKILRFLAKESRLCRRVLSEAFIQAIESTEESARRLRVATPSEISKNAGLYYGFLLYPKTKKYESDIDSYRKERRNYLADACLMIRLKYPEAQQVLGIAKTSGINNYYKSEDLFYFDCSIWDQEIEEYAKKRQAELNLFVSPQIIETTINKFPIIE